MKRILSISILIVALVCAFSQDADARKTRTKKRAKARTTRIVEGKVNKINANQYLKLVANYSSTPLTYKGSRPAVVDFNATWCGPCRMLEPVLEDLAKRYKGKVDFYSVDIDQNKAVAEAYDIDGIPTIIMFSTTGEYDKSVGLPMNEDTDPPTINTQFYIDAIEKMISDSK